jgi:hypothetical protein
MSAAAEKQARGVLRPDRAGAGPPCAASLRRIRRDPSNPCWSASHSAASCGRARRARTSAPSMSARRCASYRVARRRVRARQLLLLLDPRAPDPQAATPPCDEPSASTRISRGNGGTRPGPLRRTSGPRLASSHVGCAQLLRVRRRRTRAAFPHLGPTVAGRRRGAARGLSAIPRQLHHPAAGDRSCDRTLASSLPRLP